MLFTRQNNYITLAPCLRNKTYVKKVVLIRTSFFFFLSVKQIKTPVLFYNKCLLHWLEIINFNKSHLFF